LDSLSTARFFLTIQKSAGAFIVPATLAEALTHPEVKSAFDVFGSELPDEALRRRF
jgi:hypothetical protein